MADKTSYKRYQTANSGPNWDEYVPETVSDIGGGKFAPKVAVVNPDGTSVGATSATGALTEATFADRIGERQASPTANTVLDRLKALLTGIVLAAGANVIGKVGIDQTTSGTTNAVYPLATENHVGQVGGHIATPSATFTRPADTTAYASGDLVANSTTAGSVTPMSFTAARVAAGSFMIRRVRLRKSNTSLTNAQFRVHFYSASPTSANGDNGAWSTDGAANYLGACDVTMDRAFTDGAIGHGAPVTGSEITVALGSGQTVYALVEARAAYTPASGETFAVVIELLQN